MTWTGLDGDGSSLLRVAAAVVAPWGWRITSRMTHAHDWQVGAGCGLRAQWGLKAGELCFSLSGPLHGLQSGWFPQVRISRCKMQKLPVSSARLWK